MNDPVIRFPATRIPLDSREVSAGFSAAAQRLILVLGVVVLILALLAILCELRGIRADLGLDGGRNAPGTLEGGGR